MHVRAPFWFCSGLPHTSHLFTTTQATWRHWRPSSMTSCFLTSFLSTSRMKWPICCLSVRILGELDPVNVDSWRSDHKNTSFHGSECYEPLCVKIYPWITSVGDAGRNVLYFTYLPRHTLRTTDRHQFWLQWYYAAKHYLSVNVLPRNITFFRYLLFLMRNFAAN